MRHTVNTGLLHHNSLAGIRSAFESALAHQEQNEVRRAYNHAKYLERRRVLLFWWSEHIESAATGKLSAVRNVKQLKAV